VRQPTTTTTTTNKRKRHMEYEYEGQKLTDDLVINPDNFIPAGAFNPRNVRPWLIEGVYGPVAIVFADCEQDALDEAVDQDMLDGYLIEAKDLEEAEKDETVTYLGNASEPFDISEIHIRELPNPRFSWVAMFAASQAE
jgi:hypothetical protein